MDCLSSEQDVVAADRFPTYFECRADRTRNASVILGEWEQSDRPFQKRFQTVGIELDARTLEDAIPQFEHCNCGDKELIPCCHSAIKSFTHWIGTAVDEHDTRICIEQIIHLKDSRSGAIGCSRP